MKKRQKIKQETRKPGNQEKNLTGFLDSWSPGFLLPLPLRVFVSSCEIFGILLFAGEVARAQSPELAPIAPPIYVFPYPPWMVAVTVGVLLLLLAGIVGGIIYWWKNRPVLPPPTPRERALAALEALRGGMNAMEPYPFSIVVSDVLRLFVSEEFHVRATQQTSPEFLVAAAQSPRFSEADKTLLAAFLEKADLIKFARIHASTADSECLWEEARRFVEGGVPV